MAQAARNLTMLGYGFLNGMRYLILDRDMKFTAEFKRIRKDAGVKIVPISYQAPNMNAIAEPWVRSIKEERLGRVILVGETHLHRALARRPQSGLPPAARIAPFRRSPCGES